jgi:penicillin-insensitive murein endopeptidase
MSAVSVIKKKGLTVDERIWKPAHARLLRRAASYPEVERILVHPGIKKKLCETVTGDRSWLRKVRPFWGHDYHFHIRIGCQPGSTGCKGQAATAPGDGCDKSLAWWFTEEPWRPNKNPDAPKARDVMKMSSLPKECRMVLAAPAPESEMAATFKGGTGKGGSGKGGDTGASIASVIESAEEIVPRPDAAIGASAYLPAEGAKIPLPERRPDR